MDRRAFIVGLAAVLAAALAVEAQAGNIPRIGVLVPVEPDNPKEPNIGAFRQALRDLGYVDGQNIAVEYRYARGKAELYPALAKELVRLGVDLIVVGSWHPTLEAKKATKTIPIVGVGMGSDPVALGIVSSLARPSGNVTGSSFLTGPEFGGKYVELLKEVVPGIVRVAYVRDPRGRSAQLSSSETAQAAARSFGLAFQMFETPELPEVDGVLARMSSARGSAVIIEASLFFMAHAGVKETFMDAGGLMAYGPSLAALWQRAAIYADKILKGAKPSDLPVEQPTKFDLVINLKTAKALRLTIPQSLLLRADQIIE